MAPKRKAAFNTEVSSSDKAIVASILLHTDAEWDSAPMNMPGWVLLLGKDAPSESPQYKSLIKRGFVTSRGKVCCYSLSHAAAIMDVQGKLDRFRKNAKA